MVAPLFQVSLEKPVSSFPLQFFLFFLEISAHQTYYNRFHIWKFANVGERQTNNRPASAFIPTTESKLNEQKYIRFPRATDSTKSSQNLVGVRGDLKVDSGTYACKGENIRVGTPRETYFPKSARHICETSERSCS